MEFNYSKSQQTLQETQRTLKNEIYSLQEELTNTQGQMIVKNQYIKELEAQVDEMQGNMGSFGYEAFMKVKNDLFKKDIQSDFLAQTGKFGEVI